MPQGVQHSETCPPSSANRAPFGIIAIDLAHHRILELVSPDVEVLPQRRPLDRHRHPVQEASACEPEEQAVRVDGLDLFFVIARVDVEALRGAAVEAGRAEPRGTLYDASVRLLE